MNGDTVDRLTALGISLKHWRLGEHRAPCPWCRKGKGDDALAVKIDDDGATWFCHRCEEKGGTGNCVSDHTLSRRRDKCVASVASEPERHETLSASGQAMWNNALPIEPGTVAAAYLEHRGCIMPPVDGHLRWHPAMPYHVADQREPIHVGPALVALVTDAETAEPISIHRTWITATGKADLDGHKPRKLLWNHRSDGVIRLWPDEETTLGLVLGEGVETCLAAAKHGLAPVWSTISAGNLARFPVLPGLDGLTILVDHDRPNPKTGKRAGHEAARELIGRYVAAGFDPKRDLWIILPPTEGQDAADMEVPA